jgi:type 2 lantibiotic biosynthesis protein LanM
VREDRVHFLDAAARIGRRLCRDAVWADGRCNWLGWTVEARSGQWVTAYRAMGSSVYDGTSGIGLFLAQLAPLTGDPIIRATSEAALAQALTVIDTLSSAGEYGFYSGLSGIAWCCTESGMLLGQDALVARGRKAMLRAASIAPNAHRLDIINGSAGLIPALLDSAEREQSEELLHAAILHGEHLMNLAARTSQGWSWDTLGVPNERHLLGFAHGASGIAYALTALCAATGNQDFLDGAREALRYERAHFRPAAGNWPDLRSFVQPTSTGEQPCMVAWCHGAPGIGFARLLLNKLIANEPQVLAEAEVAIRTTAATLGEVAPGKGNLSLCHGDGGNADLLILGADLLNRPELRQIAETAGNQALSRFEETGMPWPCGIPNAGESPNLLLGLAGVGYFFLRLYDSRKTPTVLVPAAQI